MSAYASLAAARQVWDGIRVRAEARGQEVRIGNYIAEVVLIPAAAFSIEDLGEDDQHLTIWGDKDQLARAVRRIYPAAIPAE